MKAKDAAGTAGVAQHRAGRAAAALFERDRASQALGMRITEMRPGWARVGMTVRADMLNGHGVCHGGIVIPLRDTAAAFCGYAHNRRTAAPGAPRYFPSARPVGEQRSGRRSAPSRR